MAAPAQGGPRAALAFLQPVAMGVLLGQGWHVYSEVLTRGSPLGLGLCSAGVLMGLLVGVFLCARAAHGQATLRLSLFWMSCTLNGGLSAIAQLRHRIGRFHANDDALVVNSFLSSGLLGTSLPHVALKVARRPEAEVVMPCVLAVLVTEAICSNETMPALKVGVSTFLFAVGIQGIASDSNLHGDAAASAVAGSPGASEVSRKGSGVGGGSSSSYHEPFFPTTVMESRRYSPKFLVGRRPRCLPNGAAAAPLVSLVARQAGPEPSRSGGRGKERAPRGQRQRPPEDAAPLAAAAVAAQAPAVASAGAADASSASVASSASCLRAEEVLRQRGVVSAADVGTDIRWDVILEEMRRVDGGKGAKEVAAPQAPASPLAESGGLSDAPVEVFAELAEGDAELDDGIEAGGGQAAVDDADGEDDAGSDIDVAHVPLCDGEDDEDGEGGNASGPESGVAPASGGACSGSPDAEGAEPVTEVLASEPCVEGEDEEQEEEEEEEPEADAAPSRPSRPCVAEPAEQAETPPRSEAPCSDRGFPTEDAEEPPAEVAAPAPSAQEEELPAARGRWTRLSPGGRDSLGLDVGEDEYDVPWLEAEAPMPVGLDSSDDGQEAEEPRSSRSRRNRRQRARDRERGRGRECDMPPPCLSTSSAPGAGLPLIELTDNVGASPSEECDQLSLDGDMPDPAGRVSFLPMMHMSPKAVASSSLRAAAEEFVPVEACTAPRAVAEPASNEDLAEAALRQALRADAEAFLPGSSFAAAVADGAPAGGGEEPTDAVVAEAPAASELAGETDRRQSKGLKLQLFPDSLDLGSNHHSGSGLAEQPKLGFTGLDYHRQVAQGVREDRWSTPFGGEWGPASASMPMHDGGAADDMAADKKAFDGYGYPAGAWDEYAAYGSSMPADEWGAYGAYGADAGADYSQAGYDYEAAGAMGDLGATGFLSTSAAEFVPGGWGTEGQLGIGGGPEDACLDAVGLGLSAQAGGQEPVTSLMDPELPDPGLGRASAVRRGDSGPDVWQARGKKGGASSSRTLWVGDVEQWMSEGYVSDLFADMALVTNVKISHERKGGFSTGSALVELASESAAIGVLEALGGEPILAKDGYRLRVSWANSELPLAEAGYEWPTPWDGSAHGRGAEGRETRSERRARRERDRVDGRGAPGRSEDGGHAESSGGRRGRKGDGRDGGLEAEGPQRRRGDGRADAYLEARGEGGRGGGRARPGRGQEENGEACWAYVDPNDQVQVGFTSEEMRQWHELGYFDGDLRVALMRGNPERAKSAAPPPPREFYPLRQWFPDLAESFTYVPSF